MFQSKYSTECLLKRISENLASKSSNLIDIFNLPLTNNTWNDFLRHWASYIPIGFINHLCKISKFCFHDEYLKK